MKLMNKAELIQSFLELRENVKNLYSGNLEILNNSFSDIIPTTEESFKRIDEKGEHLKRSAITERDAMIQQINQSFERDCESIQTSISQLLYQKSIILNNEFPAASEYFKKQHFSSNSLFNFQYSPTLFPTMETIKSPINLDSNENILPINSIQPGKNYILSYYEDETFIVYVHSINQKFIYVIFQDGERAHFPKICFLSGILSFHPKN